MDFLAVKDGDWLRWVSVTVVERTIPQNSAKSAVPVSDNRVSSPQLALILYYIGEKLTLFGLPYITVNV